jgi:hypothetical protein
MAKSPKLSPKAFRTLLIVLWVGATVTAGIGIGLLINASNKPVATAPAEEPLPVATSSISVASASSNERIVRAQSIEPDSLQTTLSSYQVSDSADALQPGFVHFGQAQGTKGTDPVK